MNQEEELFKKRFRELADQAWQRGSYTFTGFLGLSELSVFYEMEREIAFVPHSVFGGCEDAERAMVRFGSEEVFGYREDFPIACLRIRPLQQKFADQLSHRDFLGALMNLGIDRSTLGDIVIRDNEGYLFCTQAVAPFIVEKITRIKHTTVLCETVQEPPGERRENLKQVMIQIPSERIDGVIAKVYHLSRSDSAELFRQKKVFVNGRLCENSSRMLKSEDRVSARGYGKFIYTGQQSVSKKGKLNATVLVYGG